MPKNTIQITIKGTLPGQKNVLRKQIMGAPNF